MIGIKQIIEIGKSNHCDELELSKLLPHYPTLRGDELIFKWRCMLTGVQPQDFEYLIKGLHIIELKYGGFGSPSPTKNLIQEIQRTNSHKAAELELWIALNGGNYYIKPALSSDDFYSRIAEKEKRRIVNEDGIARDAEKKKQSCLEKNKIQKGKQQRNTAELERVSLMDAKELLEEILAGSKPIYFYMNALTIKKDEINANEELLQRYKIIESTKMKLKSKKINRFKQIFQ